MTPQELPGRLARLARDVQERAMVDAANAMAQTYQVAVVRSMVGPSPSPPGTPPARRSGTLARSIRAAAARIIAAGRAMASVAPHTVYARIQQKGGVIVPVRAPYLKWKDEKGWHQRKRVKLPARPYMVMTADRRQRCRDAAIGAVRKVIREALSG